MTRWYIAGPVSGIPNRNAEAFAAETTRLRALGYDVVNPLELNPDPVSWADAMRKDLAALLTCDGVALLPGWAQSRGAMMEYNIAANLGMRVRLAWTIDEPLAEEVSA